VKLVSYLGPAIVPVRFDLTAADSPFTLSPEDLARGTWFILRCDTSAGNVQVNMPGDLNVFCTIRKVSRLDSNEIQPRNLDPASTNDDETALDTAEPGAAWSTYGNGITAEVWT
jgi:hypothetical protein